MRAQEIFETQKLDFNRFKTDILKYIQSVLDGKGDEKYGGAGVFYDIIINKPTVGSSEKVGLKRIVQPWKEYFSNSAFITDGVWSQRDFNRNLKKDNRNYNFYITIEKSPENIIKFINQLGKLDIMLDELSNKKQTRISYKTHRLLDSFVDHNDSLKIYYNDQQYKKDIAETVKNWAKDNNIELSDRTHEHGVDDNGSFGQILADHIVKSLQKAIKTNGDKYSPEQYYEWIKKYTPTLINQIKVKES